MSDISKCEGKDCEKRDGCYRFWAPADPKWQHYMEPYIGSEGCEQYWPKTKPSSPSEIPNTSPNPQTKGI